jgi:hypothetical protein
MWRISYKTMSLQDVLIMAYMNFVQAKRHEGLYSAEFTRIMETSTI